MKKVIKEQVKKEVSKITPKIEKLVNDQLESEVLVRSSKEAKTSHAVAANLSELELKKILIDKMEANNSINRSDIQRQLYKALVDAYEADKILFDKIWRYDRGSKRRRSGKEPASTSAPRETTTTTAGKTTPTGSKTHKQSASQSAPVEETMQTTNVFEAPAQQEFETGGPCMKQEEEQEVYKATTEKLDWINPEGRQYPHDLRQPLPLVPNAQGRHVEIVEWQNYKHLDWITIRRDDDGFFIKFKKEDFHRLGIQDIDRYAASSRQGKNVTRSVVIQRRMEDLQLGVESYQKKLNLTKPDTYKSNLRRRDAYTPYSDPRGFIYENKVKKNRLMRIDELHKFSDGTLDDVRTALNDFAPQKGN
ncbi:hypothetical protein Tco_0784352 [Tanacetum coccineum]